MSLDLAREVNREHLELLQTNINATCYQFVIYLLEKLRARGLSAYLVCKTQGEGQYTPPGFVPHEITGWDGKKYWCTGVSHDAVWCSGVQFDTVGGGNDSAEPIGSAGTPTWNPIPKEYWRPNNPPLLEELPPPTKPEPPTLRIPSYGELGDDAFFRAQIGVPLEADMALAGQVLNNGSSVWFSRTTYEILVEAIKAGRMIDTAPIVKKYRNQWRAILGLPPL